jgi:hypothetical protein
MLLGNKIIYIIYFHIILYNHDHAPRRPSRVVSVDGFRRPIHQRQILHVHPLLGKVPAPETEGAVLGGGGQHGAGAVPGHAPHLAGARDVLAALVRQPPAPPALLAAQQRVDAEGALPAGGRHEVEGAAHGGRPGQVVHGLQLRGELHLLPQATRHI